MHNAFQFVSNDANKNRASVIAYCISGKCGNMQTLLNRFEEWPRRENTKLEVKTIKLNAESEKKALLSISLLHSLIYKNKCSITNIIDYYSIVRLQGRRFGADPFAECTLTKKQQLLKLLLTEKLIISVASNACAHLLNLPWSDET